MKLLLDTHIWVRWLSSDQPLREDIQATIGEAELLAVSAVSCWEVAYLSKQGRLRLPCDIEQWMNLALEGSQVRPVPVSSAVAVASALLPDKHKDPADRIIIATALAMKYQLVSFDKRFLEYDELKGNLIA